MSTEIRPELSEKNPYWIDRHRYYELKHFCLQYLMWKRVSSSITELKAHQVKDIFQKNNGDPTAECAEMRTYLQERIQMLEDVAKDTDAVIGKYILKSVTEGISYDLMKAKMNVPCCRDIFYNLYRRFFWKLDKIRC